MRSRLRLGRTMKKGPILRLGPYAHPNASKQPKLEETMIRYEGIGLNLGWIYPILEPAVFN